MSMSMPSGMRFHLSSRDWPLGRLKPHPLNHGVLWGDNAHGSGSSTGLHTRTFLTHIHPWLAMLSLPFWWLALAAGCFSVDCFKTKPFESRHGAYKLFNWKEHGSLNSGDLPGRLLTKRWQCFFSPPNLTASQDSQSWSRALPASLSAAEMRNPTSTSWLSPVLQGSFLVSEKRTRLEGKNSLSTEMSWTDWMEAAEAPTDWERGLPKALPATTGKIPGTFLVPLESASPQHLWASPDNIQEHLPGAYASGMHLWAGEYVGKGTGMPQRCLAYKCPVC